MIIPNVAQEFSSMVPSPSTMMPTASTTQLDTNSLADSDSWTADVAIITFTLMLVCMIATAALLIYLHIRSKRIIIVRTENKAQKDHMKMSMAMPVLVASSVPLRQRVKDYLDFRSSSLWLLTAKSSFRTSLQSTNSDRFSQLSSKTDEKSFCGSYTSSSGPSFSGEAVSSKSIPRKPVPTMEQPDISRPSAAYLPP